MSQFDKVIGYEAVKTELLRACDVVKNPEKYAKLGTTAPRGIMLWGEPGLGKTLLAQCFIKECGCKSFTIRKTVSDGEMVRVIRKTFKQAKAAGRAIVFLDDLDKFTNEDNNHPDAEEYVTVQACIDSCKDADVFVLATANSKNCFPDSLLRSGRFDKVIELKCPKGENAVRVIQHFLSQKNNLRDVDAVEIAKVMNGHSCADLETAINEGGIYAAFEGRDYITQQDLLRACVRMIFKTPECVEEEERGSRNFAVHEAGNVVVAEVQVPGSVNFVAIGGYTGETGGITNVYTPDDAVYTKEEIEQKVMLGLAGKAATEVVLGVVDVGCNEDMWNPFDLLHKLTDDLCAYGFDTYVHIGGSESLRQKKEQLVALQLNMLYLQTKKILTDNRAFLDKITEALIEKKILMQKDIKTIKGSC